MVCEMGQAGRPRGEDASTPLQRRIRSGFENWNVSFCNAVFFVVFSSSDLWVPDPPSDARRTVIERSLNSYGQNVATLAGTYLVASSSPAANSCTVYTMAMSAAENEFTITMPS